MDLSRRILLYGNSVILGTLGASLGRFPQFEVTTLTPPLPKALEMAALNPDIVLFDLEANHAKAIFPLLDCCPGLLLLGVSPDTNLVKMWAGQQLQELSIQGLLELISEKSKGRLSSDPDGRITRRRYEPECRI